MVRFCFILHLEWSTTFKIVVGMQCSVLFSLKDSQLPFGFTKVGSNSRNVSLMLCNIDKSQSTNIYVIDNDISWCAIISYIA